MNTKELASIKEVANDFLSKNKERLDIIKEFEDQIVELTKDNFPQTIQLIKDHPEVFLKDHSTISSFIHLIERASVFHFQKFELILDIVIYFWNEIRQRDFTEYELIDIFKQYQVGQNYFYYKNIISIETIFKHSLSNNLIFIKFIPELRKYDEEYVQKRSNNLQYNDTRNKQLYNDVQSNPDEHIKNRNTNCHPSPLHKAIREDNIDTFQSLLYKNNYGINYRIPFSYYERAQTIDHNLALIQIAATYSSINIFKFLWMQNDIDPPDNLLQYAFFGGNPEIIHLCENKVSHDRAILQTIYMFRFDLLDYYLDNFSDEIEEKNEVIKEIKFEENDSDDLYNCLNYGQLKAALNYFSVPVIKSCLPKIIYIIKNVDFKVKEIDDDDYLIFNSMIYFDLFKFFYSQNKQGDSECFVLCLLVCLFHKAFDAFKFLLCELKGKFEVFSLFKKCLRYADTITINCLFDIQLDELNSDSDEKLIYNEMKDNISVYNMYDFAIFCDEDMIVKAIKLYSFLFDRESIKAFIKNLLRSYSQKMIESLFDKLNKNLLKEDLQNIASLLKKTKYSDMANLIKV